MTNPGTYHQALSQNVRRLRTARAWSLDELARRSGISRAMIVQIEGTRTNASLGTICQLADALAVPVQTLLAIVADRPIRVVRGGGTESKLWNDGRGSWARLLSGVGHDRHIELWEWRLVARAAYQSAAHSPGTRETLWIHRGGLEVMVGTVSARAGAGDVIQFDAASAHHYQAVGRLACEFSMIVELPVPGGEPALAAPDVGTPRKHQARGRKHG